MCDKGEISATEHPYINLKHYLSNKYKQSFISFMLFY